MKASRTKEKKFNRLILITIIAVYLVILAGGIVRSTGSGMGCPDWPKCFGSWIPPTSEAELPANYRQQFAQVRVEKNARLAGYLEFFGFNDLASAIQHESIATPEAQFNKYKTWIEYINRLLGVLVGFLITIMTVSSYKLRTIRQALFYGSIGAFLLVVFQGWIGSVVVSTNLLPGLITFHMALAALLIGVLFYLFEVSSSSKVPALSSKKASRLRTVLIFAMILFSIQIAIGTQVRESIDVIALTFERSNWVENLGGIYYFHRTFSLVLLAMGIYLVVLLNRTGNPLFLRMARLVILLLGAEIVLGMLMAYSGVPAWAQPLHLIIALGLLGLEFWLYLKLIVKQG